MAAVDVDGGYDIPCSQPSNEEADRGSCLLPICSELGTISIDLLANPDCWSSPSLGETVSVAASRLQDEVTSRLISCNNAVDRLHARFSATLTSVHLAHCCLDDTFAITFARHSWPALQWLDLKHNRIGDEGAVALSQLVAPLIQLDLSNNRLTAVGLVHIADELMTGCLRSLQQLHLADLEQLLPVRIFQKFASAMEKNFCLQKLTLGYETLTGPPSTDGAASPKEWDEMDAILRYWWQEPAFRCATRRIRFLLRLNYARSTALVLKGGTKHDPHPIDKLCWVQSLFDSQQAQEVVFLLLQAQPTLVGELISA